MEEKKSGRKSSFGWLLNIFIGGMPVCGVWRPEEVLLTEAAEIFFRKKVV